jgi:hypothetical protein
MSSNEKFKRGYCLAFAHALQECFGSGAELYDVVEPASTPASNFDGLPHHIVVKYRGKYFDVDGIHSAENLLDRWQKDFSASGYPLSEKLVIEPHNVERADDYKLKDSVSAQQEAMPKARAIAAKYKSKRKRRS